jgi:hypothetical protein
VVVLHQGTPRRHRSGYYRKDALTYLSWQPSSVEVRIASLTPREQRHAVRAYEWLLEHSSIYRAWVEAHTAHLASGHEHWLSYNVLLRPLIECAVWPHLYWKRTWCESNLYAEDDWRPMSLAKQLMDNKRSMKASFALKLRCPIIDYGASVSLIQFQFDRFILRDMLLRSSIALSNDMSLSLTVVSKSWSKQYWAEHHYGLIDLVRQKGYPQLFLTVSPYEWLFPWPQEIVSSYEKLNGGPTDVPGLETLCVAHVIHEVCSKFLCGSGSGKPWKKFLLCNKQNPNLRAVKAYYGRYEYQDGGMEKQVGRGRGSLHLHMLIWLQEHRDVLLEQLFTADFTDDPYVDALARKVQRGDINKLPLSGVTHWDTDSGEPQLVLKQSPEFKFLGLRPFVTSLLRLLRCSQDIQYDTGRAALLRYVSGYLTKLHESFDSTCLDREQGFAGALLAAQMWRPATPEQVMILSRQKLYFTNVTTIKYRPPLPWVELDEKVYLYRSREEEAESLSMIEWLRTVVISGPVGQRSAHSRKRQDLVCVAADYISIESDSFFYQWLLLNLPHRIPQDLHHPRLVSVPYECQWQFLSLLLVPQKWSCANWVLQWLREQGDREEWVQTSLARLLLRNQWIHSLARGESFLLPRYNLATPIPDLNQEQTTFVRDALAQLHAKRSALESGDLHAHTNLVRCQRPSFLTGGPGTGKSVTCYHLMRLAQASGYSVLRANPTGMLAASSPHIPGIRSITFHKAFGINSRSKEDMLHSLHPYDVWVLGEIGMITQCMFDYMYSLYTALGCQPVIIMEGDFAQLPPPTTPALDARQSRSWKWVRTVTLISQHRCTDETLNNFALLCRTQTPEWFHIFNVFKNLSLGLSLDQTTILAAHAFVLDGFIVAATTRTVDFVNTELIESMPQPWTRPIPVWDQGTVLYTKFKLGATVRITWNHDTEQGSQTYILSW